MQCQIYLDIAEREYLRRSQRLRISESNVEFIRTLPDVSVFGAAKARKVGRRGANAGFAIKNRASLFQRCNPLSGSGGESANNLIFFAAGAHRVGKNRNFVRVKENPRIMIYDNILGNVPLSFSPAVVSVEV